MRGVLIGSAIEKTNSSVKSGMARVRKAKHTRISVTVSCLLSEDLLPRSPAEQARVDVTTANDEVLCDWLAPPGTGRLEVCVSKRQ